MLVKGNVSIIGFMMITTITIVAPVQSNIDSGDIGITQTRGKRGILKGAREIIGKTLPKLPLTLQKFAHYLRAKGVLKADTTFFKQNGVYMKEGGLDRANFDFHRMDVTNVELYKIDAGGLVKKGYVGNGWAVRFIVKPRKDPQIILYKLTTMRMKTSTIHVKYTDD